MEQYPETLPDHVDTPLDTLFRTWLFVVMYTFYCVVFYFVLWTVWSIV